MVRTKAEAFLAEPRAASRVPRVGLRFFANEKDGEPAAYVFECGGRAMVGQIRSLSLDEASRFRDWLTEILAERVVAEVARAASPHQG
jgi:hypothetical protein